MIKWCSFCQKFTGECPPYEDMSFTHGMCEPCALKGLSFTPESKQKILELAKLQKSLWDLGKLRKFNAALARVDEFISKGIRPADFLMGFVSPMLSNAHTDPAHCEDLKKLCDEIVEVARHKIRTTLQGNPKIDVLIAVPSGNLHHFGGQVLELWLLSEGIAAKSFIPKNNDSETLNHILDSKPTIVCFSVSTRDHAEPVRRLVLTVKRNQNSSPLFLVGGPGVKFGAIKPEDIAEASLVSDTTQLLMIIKAHLSLGFLYDLKRRAI